MVTREGGNATMIIDETVVIEFMQGVAIGWSILLGIKILIAMLSEGGNNG